MANVKAAADAVKLAATWQATSATSSDPSIVATGSSTALAGTSTTFSVTALAQSQVSTAALTDATNVTADYTQGLDITIGAATSPTHLALAGNTASDVVAAVNAANLGVKAALITTSPGHQILQFAATSSGLANAFTVGGLTDRVQSLTAAADAQITVGQLGSGGYQVTSSSNTFTNAVPGVTLTTSKLTTATTVSVSADPTSVSTAVQSLVSAVNSALLTISASTAQGQVLQGDSLATEMTNQLLRTVSGGGPGGESFTSAGVDVSATGLFSFDSSAFTAAFTADPIGTESLIGSSLSGALSSVADQASNAATGSLSSAITTDAAQETALANSIDAWSKRLTDQQAALTAKFAAMESALSKLKSQGSYLTQMFNSMNGTSSSSSSGSTSQ